MENIWATALSTLKSEVNEQVLTAWFLPIKQVSINDSSITLGVPNNFFEGWIREKYISLIKTSIQQSAGKNIEVQFSIVEVEPSDAITAPPSPGGSITATAGSASAPATAAGDTETQTGPKDEKEYGVGWLRSVFGGTRAMPDSRYQQIGLNPRYTFENFVVGSNNRFAHAAAMAVCEKLSKVYNPLFLYGGVGLGKTHLMQAMGHEIHARYPRAKVLYMTSEEFCNQLIAAIRKKQMDNFRDKARNVDVLLVDDIQFIAGKNATQEEFFHTFNALHDSHKQIVLCSDRSPQEIKALEERMVSRFAWGLIADIQLPDFETRIAIMEKKCENESVKVSKEVLYFLAENIKSNIREMEGALIRVVAYAKLTGSDISVGMARQVLKGMISVAAKKISIELIQTVVAEYFNITDADMKTKKRTRSIVYPRQLAMYLSRELTDYSFPDIGGFFGGKDHTTVLHACDKISKEIKGSGETRSMVEKLTSLIKG
ncbi:MAG: chromosomal replication initiator protein DnaA [Candidatus Tantalella remota]|nr:chromosomal replication initiator protein DnaA [Candidatus Tantalella remota]